MLKDDRNSHSNIHNNTVIMVAKFPTKGVSKTRLYPILGEENTFILAQAMLADLLNSFSSFASFPPGRKILCTPERSLSDAAEFCRTVCPDREKEDQEVWKKMKKSNENNEVSKRDGICNDNEKWKNIERWDDNQSLINKEEPKINDEVKQNELRNIINNEERIENKRRNNNENNEKTHDNEKSNGNEKKDNNEKNDNTDVWTVHPMGGGAIDLSSSDLTAVLTHALRCGKKCFHR